MELRKTEIKTTERLLLFERSIGKKFKSIYIPPNGELLIDEIIGVDWKYNHVCGKKYGNFHVDYVELVKD